MPAIRDITTAVYRLLAADGALAGMCGIYKGAKRPVRAANPSLTVRAERLARGGGEGIWMCDITVTAYADMLPNGTADTETLDGIMGRVNTLLADAEIELAGAKTMPLIEGDSTGPLWDRAHADEAYCERVYGLLFVGFR